MKLSQLIVTLSPLLIGCLVTGRRWPRQPRRPALRTPLGSANKRGASHGGLCEGSCRYVQPAMDPQSRPCRRAEVACGVGRGRNGRAYRRGARYGDRLPAATVTLATEAPCSLQPFWVACGSGISRPRSLTCVIDNQIDRRADDKEWKEHVHQVVPPIPGRRITVDNDAASTSTYFRFVSSIRVHRCDGGARGRLCPLWRPVCRAATCETW